jgi:hypothetical protein
VSRGISLEGHMAERTVPVTVNFRAAQADQLRELAVQEHRSLSGQVQHLVDRGLEAEYEAPEDEAA